MISVNSKSLLRECVATLISSGSILFLLGLVLSQQILSDNQLSIYFAVAIAISGGVVAYSSSRFRRRLTVSDRVEQQLANFFKAPATPATVLHPILDSSAIGRGWNQLIQVFQDRQTDQAIERRLQQQAAGGNSGERFARALRSLPYGIAITDSNGRISYANTAWSGAIPDPKDPDGQLNGKNIIEGLAASAYRNWDDLADSILDGTKPMKFELRVGASVADGVIQLSRNPLEGRMDESQGFVWTLRDVTQSCLARESHEQFLASATHELRTPLTNIKAYTESLIEVDDISPHQQKEFFNVIHSEAERLGRLLNQLLDIQQLDAGSMTLTSSSFDVLRMVREVQDQIGPLIEEKGLTLTCRIAPDLKTIEADKEKVISCVVNLLGNAVKYTPTGGEVRLLAEQLEQSVALAVEDTGIGIAEEELPKIFDRFYRCQDERVHDVEGNGLGLAFAMEVARLHHGELKVDSQLDKGSRFTLKLPIMSKG